MFNTPILFLVFNRPATTTRVFDAIKQAKPTRLFIAADGPRKQIEGEQELCWKTRELVVEGIDWECDVKTLFRKENIGCGRAVSEAITWFFEYVEEGIILEDDTLPNESFFYYCAVLLDKYRNNESVMSVSGNTFHSFSRKRANNDNYYFSSFPFIWGWATWKRAWVEYKIDIVKTSSVKDREYWINNAFRNSEISKFWIDLYERTTDLDESYTWDYQWFLTIWKNSGKTVLPERNLVVNIGWGKDATHTTEENHHLSKLKSYKIRIQSELSPRVELNDELEWNNFANFYLPHQLSFFDQVIVKCRSAKRKFFGKIRNLVKRIILKILFIKVPQLAAMDRYIDDLEYYLSRADDSFISPKSRIYKPYKFLGSSLGDYSYIAPNSHVICTNIGKFCSIGMNFKAGYGIHPVNGISTSPMFYSTKMQNGTSLSQYDKIIENKPIEIGHDVFIGMNVTILDGVKVGNGCIIGAGAVVTRDLPPYAIVGGIPAKIIKYRFDDEEIQGFEQINWYDFNDKQLEAVEKSIFDVSEFLHDNKQK
jgi:acetyltransferase-like isoleucine patch superfamily enzyme